MAPPDPALGSPGRFLPAVLLCLLGACASSTYPEDATPTDGQLAIPCGDARCGQGMLCVTTHSTAGPMLFPDDAGVCPAGWSPFGSSPYRRACYSGHSVCVARPSGCSPLSCSCAEAVCSAVLPGPGTRECFTPGDEQLDCVVIQT